MNGRKVAFNWRLLYFSMYKVTNDKKKLISATGVATLLWHI